MSTICTKDFDTRDVNTSDFNTISGVLLPAILTLASEKTLTIRRLLVFHDIQCILSTHYVQCVQEVSIEEVSIQEILI